MTLAGQHVPVIAWDEPGGLIPRGTVVVIPGRGELPAVYERFGRRLAADAYRVRAVTDPVLDAGLARAQISGLLAGSSLPAPRVLAGSDTGALFAIMLARSGLGAAVDALVLAGLPTTPQAGSAGSWDEELGADQHHGGAARRAQRPDPPYGGRRRRAVPGTAPAGRRPAPDCGLGAAGMRRNGPGLCMPEHERRVLVMC